jgi:hypothetical protein
VRVPHLLSYGRRSSLLVSTDAERAARQIVTAVRERRARGNPYPPGQVVTPAAGDVPEFTSAALHLAQELFLPADPGRIVRPSPARISVLR